MTWKGPCGAFVTTDLFFFFLEELMVQVCCACHSHAGLPWSGSVNRLFVDPTTRQEWCRRRHVASPPPLRRVQICPVLAVLTNPAFRVPLRLTVSCKIPVTNKKKHGLKMQMLGQRSQGSAGDFGGGHDTQTYVSSG